jgi:hypothetical protein
MINIEPVQVNPLAVKTKITNINISFNGGLSVVVWIGLFSEDDQLLKNETVSLTEEEYLDWGVGSEGDAALLNLCLTKLNIELES